MSENACRRKLDSVKGGRISCDLVLGLAEGTLRVSGRAAGIECSAEYRLGALEAARTTDMEGVLRAQFSKCGDTPFTLASLSAPGFPAVLIPQARLKDIRREFYRLLEEKALKGKGERLRLAREAALRSLVGTRPTASGRKEDLAVRVESIRDFHLLHQEGVDGLILPVSKANIHQLPAFAAKLRGRHDTVTWHLPFIVFEADLPYYREAVKLIASHGFRRFEVSNLAHFQLLAGHEVEISSHYRLFSLNSQALLSWHEEGVKTAALYLEDDAENMADLLAADVPAARRVLLFAPVPVITSKIAIKGVRADSPVMSDRGDAYTVTARDGLTTVTADRRFAISGYRRRLRDMGCSSFEADLSLEPGDVRRLVLDACIRGMPIEGTSEFNFTMGLT